MPLFPAVPAGKELARVFALPRRDIPDPEAPESIALAKELTGLLKRVPVPYPFKKPEHHLYATQALALKELFECRGLLAPIRVGGGKSLTAYLAFAILKPKRPLLVVPASMVTDTEIEWRKFERDWQGPRFEDVRVLSYEKLSNPSSGAKVLLDGTEVYPDILRRYMPDMVVMDECDRFGEVSATGTRRMGRYLAENPTTVVLAMSGTLIRRSLKDAAHIAEWCLHDQAPLPLNFEELQPWSDALDARGQKGKRTEFGALMDHLSSDELKEFSAAESADDARGVVVGMVGRRILETAGVVGSQDGPLGIPARIDPYEVEDEDEAIEEQYALLLDGDGGERAAWTLPDGTLLPDARSLARPLTTLGYGLILIQDPPAPEEYRMARSAWHSTVRETIRYRPGLRLDSEWMVRDAVRRGVLPEFVDLLEGWESAQAAYRTSTGLREPPSVPMWFSDEVVAEARRWLDQGTGLIWVGYIALGERLSKELGLPYFGAGKTDAKGRHVTKLKRGEPAILSISSVGRGTNGLQFAHHRQLWMGAPSEQPLARLHRPGQEADCVLNDVYLGAGAHLARFWRAHSTATNFAGRISRQAQKLQYFQSFVPETLSREGRRWSSVATTAVADVGEDALALRHEEN